MLTLMHRVKFAKITGSGLPGDTTSIASVEEGNKTVHTFRASEQVTWSLEGDDVDLFEISSEGVLGFKSAPDYETPVDTGDTEGNNTYVISVKATDDK